MLKKLIHIKNYGKFSNFNIASSDWDGTFKKNNVIYAPNGSGKTSLSVLLRSIKGDASIVHKKKTFDAQNPPTIKLILDDGKELKFESKWNKTISHIEVFDSFYFENNLYSITIDDDPEKANIFELAIKDEIEKIKKQILDTKNKREVISRKITNRKNYLKRQSIDHKNDKQILSMAKERDELDNAIKQLEKERLENAESQRNKYIGYINKYLSLFCDTMKLTEIKTSRNAQTNQQNIVYGIEINGHNITIKERSNTSLKYFLSDGDKNALALSFFLARMDMLPDLSSYIVVVDDPFTSFDTHRKLTTITQLNLLCQKVKQFIILTHDLHFANDFNNVCTDDILNLKIRTYNSSSALFIHDIKTEMLTGLYKDLMTLRTFISSPKSEDQIYLREVIRCIRPCIEGIFRIKYFNYIQPTHWLGDFIKMIRDANETSPFFKLKVLLDELDEINNYSKTYHHSNPNFLEVGISLSELRNYVRRTLKLIEAI